MKNVKISNLNLNKLKLKKEKQSKYNKYSKIKKSENEKNEYRKIMFVQYSLGIKTPLRGVSCSNVLWLRQVSVLLNAVVWSAAHWDKSSIAWPKIYSLS